MARKKNLRVYQDEFIEMYKKGMSIREIAEQFDVSQNMVRTLIKEKIKLRPKSSINKELGEKIYKDYITGMGLRNLSNKYSISATSIQLFLVKEYNVKFYGSRKYDHLTEDFIRCYEEGMSLGEIADKYGASKQTILNYLNKNDKKARTYKESGLKYQVDSNYFDELNSEKAYDLGMIFYMTTITLACNKQEFLNIKINLTKEDLLVKLVSKFTNKGVSSIEHTSKDGKLTTSYVRIFEENLINKLKDYGLGSKDDINIDDKYLYDFFRGYFSLAITVNQRTFHISVKNMSKEKVKSYLSGFMDTTLITEKKTAVIIGKKKSSIELLNKHKELVKKIEEYISNNDYLLDNSIERWKDIKDRIK